MELSGTPLHPLGRGGLDLSQFADQGFSQLVEPEPPELLEAIETLLLR
jgi:hypothetical protein